MSGGASGNPYGQLMQQYGGQQQQPTYSFGQPYGMYGVQQPYYGGYQQPVSGQGSNPLSGFRPGTPTSLQPTFGQGGNTTPQQDSGVLTGFRPGTPTSLQPVLGQPAGSNAPAVSTSPIVQNGGFFGVQQGPLWQLRRNNNWGGGSY